MTVSRLRIIAASALVLGALALSGCAVLGNDPVAHVTVDAGETTTVQAVLEKSGWEDLSGRDLVEVLEALPLDERPQNLIASVRSTSVELSTPSGDVASVPIAEEFYLSIAPYRDQTHPCGFHSLTTCRGEMSDVDVKLHVRDVATGDVVREEIVRTEANGFVGVWLPRDGQFEVTIDADGRTASTTISTGVDDPTCLTTLQLT